MAQGLNNNWQNLKLNATDFINTNILWANYAAQWNNADFWEQDLWNNNTRNINNWNINQLWDDNLVANTKTWNANQFLDNEDILNTIGVRQNTKKQKVWNAEYFEQLGVTGNNNFAAQWLEEGINTQKAEITRLDNTINAQKTALEEKKAAAVQRQEDLNNKKTEFEEARTKLANEQKALEDIKEKIIEKNTERQKIENELRNKQNELFTNGQNVNNMAEIAQLNAKLANIDAEIGTIMVEFFTVKNNIQDARQKTGTAYGQALLIENNINRLTSETNRIENNIKTLEAMKTTTQAALDARTKELEEVKKQAENTNAADNTANDNWANNNWTNNNWNNTVFNKKAWNIDLLQ